MRDIGIIGAGIAGLHLGLLLLQRGIKPTLYAEHRPEEMRQARLPSTVALFHTTLEQAKQLGVAHWETPDTYVRRFNFGIKGVPDLGFDIPLRVPYRFIDMRLCLPRWLEDFASRGGREETRGTLDAAAVASLAGVHDLVVVASGRGELAEMFPRVPERLSLPEPRRRVMGGLFRGIRFVEPFHFGQQVVPEQGEICDLEILTQSGPASGLFVLAVPGGALEGVTRVPYDDVAALNQAVLEMLRENAPKVMERIDPAAFGLLGPLDVVHGAVLPVARRGFRELSPGRFALALGDAHLTLDPITAQGANLASKGARLLADLLEARIEAQGAFDGAFCASAEERLWEMLRPAAEWNNLALQPPPPHLFELLGAATHNPAIAQDFAANFDDPARQWEVLKSPEGTAAFIRR